MSGRAAHPRLLAGENSFREAVVSADANDTLHAYILDLKKQADEILKTELPTYEDSDVTRLSAASTISRNIQVCALMYKLSGEEAYKTRAVSELANAAAFPNWNPQAHFLDTATIACGFALGYDWLYDALTQEQRSQFAQTLYDYAVVPAQTEFEARANGNKYCDFNWTQNAYNWNTVCNSGIIVACLAIADEPAYQAAATELIEKCMHSVQQSIKSFSVDGAWPEGPTYAAYLMGYYMTMTEALMTALGKDYGYGSAAAVGAFHHYIVRLNGLNEVFNFGDGGEAMASYSGFMLYAVRSGDAFYAAYANELIQRQKSSVGVLDVLYYDPRLADYDMSANPAVGDGCFAGINTAVFHKGSFGGNAAFAGIHGGYNNVPHGHLDAGTFVYDVSGVRFASDLGQDNYNLYAYWTTDPTAEKNRWAYYRMRAEGHNTLVINPSSGPDQAVESESRITDYHSSAAYGYAVLDMSDAYADNASKVNRGLYFNKENNSLLIQDEYTLSAQSDVYWFMHTAAAAEVSADGKSAVLTRWGKRVWIGIIEGDGVLTCEEDIPFASSPNPNVWPENRNNGLSQATDTSFYRKIQIKQTGVLGEQRLAVYMIPLAEGETAPAEIPNVKNLSEWQ